MAEPAVVEQAKGVLMLRFGIGSYESLAVLQGWAVETGHTLLQVSQAITHALCQGHTRAWCDDPSFIRWLEQRFREDLAVKARTPAVAAGS